nr:MAG TPA: Effector protein NleG [Caudoviricetes sp.]
MHNALFSINFDFYKNSLGHQIVCNLYDISML